MLFEFCNSRIHVTSSVSIRLKFARTPETSVVGNVGGGGKRLQTCEGRKRLGGGGGGGGAVDVSRPL